MRATCDDTLAESFSRCYKPQNLSPSAWKLVVTPLGTQAGALEVEVWADNWLSALRAGRKELGEDGGVPQGASCAMSESGVVTILDAHNRRRFVLEPKASALEPETSAEPAAAPDSGTTEPAVLADAASAEVIAAPLPQAPSPPGPLPSEPLPAPAQLPAQPQPTLAAPQARSSEPARLDPRAPLTTPPQAAPVTSKPAPARGASSPALPPVGLAAIRAAAELVQTQPPEAPVAPSTPAPAQEPAVAQPTQAPAPGTAADALPPVQAAVLRSHAEAPRASTRTSDAAPPGADSAQPDSLPASADAPGAATTPSASPDLAETTDGDPATETDSKAAEDRSSPRAKQTRAYSAQRAEAIRKEFETSRALAGASTTSSGPPAADAGKGLPRPSLRAVPPVPVAASSASAAPESNVAAPDAPAPPAVGGPAARDARDASDSPPARVSVPRVSHPQGLVLLVARDAEPSAESPLTYRERAYWVAPSADHARLEALLQAEFIDLRRELLSRPRGQLIHLAAFDHVFDENPTRPPLATLEWKDWRGTAVFSVTVEPEEGEERSAVLERPPAPHAPESEWPLPSTSWPRDRPSSGRATPPSTWPVPAAGRAPQPRRAVPPTSARAPEGSLRPREPALPLPGSSSWPLPPSMERATRARPERGPRASTWPAAAPSAAPPGSEWPPASAFDARAEDPRATGRGPRASEPAGSPPARAGSEWPLPAATTPPVRSPAEQPRAPSAGGAGSAWPPVASTSGLGSWPAAPASLPGTPARGFDPFPAAASTREPTGEVDHRLATAFEAMPELYFLATPVSGLEFTIELIATLVPCEAISACLYDINTDEFRFVALSGTGAAVRRASAVASQAGLFGVAKRAPAEALVVASAATDVRFDPKVDGREELEVRSLLYLPVRFAGQLLGMLQLINRTHARSRAEEQHASLEVGFTPADVAVLTYVTTQLAEFLLSRRSLG